MRVVFAVGCLAKFIHGATGGGWQRFDEGKISYFLMRRRRGEVWTARFASFYKPLLVARIVAAAALAVGLYSPVSAVLVACGLAFEMMFIPRFLTFFMLLVSLILACAGDLGGFLSIDRDRVGQENSWAQAMIILLAVDLYVNTAWLKLRSAQFRSGRVISQWMTTAQAIRPRLAGWNFYYPKPVQNILCHGDGSPKPAAAWAARVTILVEFLIPVGLLYPPTMLFACAVGILSHFFFMLMLPRHLVTYSICTVSTYFAFAAG